MEMENVTFNIHHSHVVISLQDMPYLHGNKHVTASNVSQRSVGPIVKACVIIW